MTVKVIQLMGWAALAIAAIAGSAASADDTMSQAAPTKSQLVKDCIRKHRTDDVSLSKSQLNRVCKDEINAQQAAGGSPPPPAPPTDGPNTAPPP